MYPCQQENKMAFAKRKRLEKVFAFEEKPNGLSICIPEVYNNMKPSRP